MKGIKPADTTASAVKLLFVFIIVELAVEAEVLRGTYSMSSFQKTNKKVNTERQGPNKTTNKIGNQLKS